jgi:hypothetical protein
MAACTFRPDTAEYAFTGLKNLNSGQATSKKIFDLLYLRLEKD